MSNLYGIWIDKKEAKIVRLDEAGNKLKTIPSNVEGFRPTGGSGTKVKGGPQDVVQDSKYSEREKHQLRAFFGIVADQVSQADSIVIFGPAQTGIRLRKEWSESHPNLYKKVSTVEKADSMTDNQVIAWVRDYYSE